MSSLLACIHVAVSLRLDSAEISVSEGANSVNVTITRIGSTTVDIRVILNTVQNGTAVGKSLIIIFLKINIHDNFFQLMKTIFQL